MTFFSSAANFEIASNCRRRSPSGPRSSEIKPAERGQAFDSSIRRATRMGGEPPESPEWGSGLRFFDSHGRWFIDRLLVRDKYWRRNYFGAREAPKWNRHRLWSTRARSSVSNSDRGRER